MFSPNDNTSDPKGGAWNHLEHEPQVFDVLIIGAGPCGLAVAARIHEHAPSAMFTDEEHRRWSWLKNKGNKLAVMQVKTGRVKPASEEKKGKSPYKMAVLDGSGEGWLSRWKTLFSTFGISHLRSPMIWHIDPQHRDALLSHAHFQGRDGELVEIKNCVGKEVSKHHKKQKQKKHNHFSGGKQESSIDINQRDQWDYYTPSQPLFCDHCDSVARRYHLEQSMVHKEIVTDIRYGLVEDCPDDDKIFTVVTNMSVRYARAVILAVGPANSPVLPPIPSLSFPGQSADNANMPQACHSMQIPQRGFPDPIVKERIHAGRKTNVLVIGGGLTSAQLSNNAINKGVHRVFHLMRGPLVTKHFDVDLGWMGKYKTLYQGYFHQADSDEERSEIIKKARGGGSIPSAYLKKIQPHISSGKLKMFQNTILTGAHFEQNNYGEGGVWKVTTEPPIDDLPPFDYIYFATGIQSDFKTLPYLKNMLKDYPIQGFGGFPCLNEDLMWQDDVPLFVTGKLAALRIGPAAPNIGGARIGAERIALALDQAIARTGSGNSSKETFFTEKDTVVNERRDSGIDIFNYASGTGSKYCSLGEDSA
ncbi:hypothetical protein N0V82_000705 [Gnomoniopsis sp. IMI 355080]|nr:hypothetical protein N0V82_000705 [Gnomoniopsis sp. IMI 355080]